MSTHDEPKGLIPLSVRLNPELSMFLVTRYRGRPQSGFGVPIPIDRERYEEDIEAGEEDKAMIESESVEESNAEDTGKDTPDKPTTVTKEHFFIEDVVFLHERGLVEVNDEKNIRLDSPQLYNLLGPLGVSLPSYLVNAHLRAQKYRVVRHTPARRQILEDMETMLERTTNNEDKETVQNSMSSLRQKLRQDAIKAPAPRVATSSSPSVAFDVYEPNAQFARTNPGLPDFHVAVSYYNEPRLSFDALTSLLRECRGIPLKIATVSDAGTVIMFGITDDGVPERNNESA